MSASALRGEDTAPQLTCYVVDGHQVDIRPAPLERDWMDRTHQRFAYRCLPLNIANMHGWELLCPAGFAAVWDGSSGKEGISILPDNPGTMPAVSHFAHAILTFHVPAVFRTEPGTSLFITGPINRPKDAVAPLTGVVETDWAPYTFTMNWMFTRANTPVRFERGEPFCHIFPVENARLEILDPEIVPLPRAPDIEHDYKLWSASRDGFNADLKVEGSQAREQRWQKSYFRGQRPSGEPAAGDTHRSKLKLKPFRQT